MADVDQRFKDYVDLAQKGKIPDNIRLPIFTGACKPSSDMTEDQKGRFMASSNGESPSG